MMQENLEPNADQGQKIEQVSHHEQIENARMRLYRAYVFFNEESQEAMLSLKEPLRAVRAVKGDVATYLDMIQHDFETGLKNNLQAVWNNWRAADSVMEGIAAIARRQEYYQKERATESKEVDHG